MLKDSITIKRADGFRLTYTVRVGGFGFPLVLLHGFTGSGAAWTDVAPVLMRQFTVICPDLLGHGETDAPEESERYMIDHSASDIVAVCRALGYEQFALHGYSMGGRLALYLALHHQSAVTALGLESASPGLRSLEERIARQQSDTTLAEFIEANGVEAFVDRWEKLPLFEGLRGLPPDKQAALRQMRDSQRVRGLAHSLRGMGTGFQPSLWERLGEIAIPTQIMTGALDRKFSEIGAEMAQNMSGAVHVSIPDAGHTIHLEQADAWLDNVSAFFKR